MRVVLLLCLAFASYKSSAAQPPDLQNEDLQAVKDVLREKDPSLDWFHALDKKPVDATYSVMVVEAAPTELRPGASRRSPVGPLTQIGVFVVKGKANQVQLVLDTYPLGSLVANPHSISRARTRRTCTSTRITACTTAASSTSTVFQAENHP